MRNIFTVPKKKALRIEEIAWLQIIFDNGDFLPINHTEVVGYRFDCYDRLVSFHNGYAPRARSGEVRLRLKRAFGAPYDQCQLFDSSDYRIDRIKAISERLVRDGGIKAIRFFDGDNFNFILLGNFLTESSEGEAIIKAIPNSVDEPYGSDCFHISLAPVRKEDMRIVGFEFENCEHFDVYEDEILSFDVLFGNELEVEPSLLYRQITGGKMRLKFKETHDDRNCLLSDFECMSQPVTLAAIRKRLTGEKGFDFINLCHLYVKSNHVGFGLAKEEQLCIKDVRPMEIVDGVDETNENDGCDDGPFEYFLGGTAKEVEGEIVEITFGVFPKALQKQAEKDHREWLKRFRD